jgi:hypothetical protein
MKTTKGGKQVLPKLRLLDYAANLREVSEELDRLLEQHAATSRAPLAKAIREASAKYRQLSDAADRLAKGIKPGRPKKTKKPHPNPLMALAGLPAPESDGRRPGRPAQSGRERDIAAYRFVERRREELSNLGRKRVTIKEAIDAVNATFAAAIGRSEVRVKSQKYGSLKAAYSRGKRLVSAVQNTTTNRE